MKGDEVRSQEAYSGDGLSLSPRSESDSGFIDLATARRERMPSKFQKGSLTEK